MKTDPVLARLRELQSTPPSAELSGRIRQRAHVRLRARPLHPVLTSMVAASVVSYLGWAIHFSRAWF